MWDLHGLALIRLDSLEGDCLRKKNYRTNGGKSKTWRSREKNSERGWEKGGMVDDQNDRLAGVDEIAFTGFGLFEAWLGYPHAGACFIIVYLELKTHRRLRQP